MDLLEKSPLQIFDQKYLDSYNLICGIDEAGRGPIAGPVVVAGVILKKDHNLFIIKDSKKLTKKMREKLYPEIINNSLAYFISEIDNNIIDEINILNATKKGIDDVILNLKIKPDFILIDYVSLTRPLKTKIPHEAIIKGDEKSLHIAAASILAKVYRDSLMIKYHNTFPNYEFNKHKGYPTKKHYELIKKYGPSKIHRLTFKNVQ